VTRAEAHEKVDRAKAQVLRCESDLDDAERMLSDAKRQLARFDGTPSPLTEQGLQHVRDWLDRQVVLGMPRDQQAVVQRLIEDMR